jgi:hypothetical protein
MQILLQLQSKVLGLISSVSIVFSVDPKWYVVYQGVGRGIFQGIQWQSFVFQDITIPILGTMTG